MLLPLVAARPGAAKRKGEAAPRRRAAVGRPTPTGSPRGGRSRPAGRRALDLPEPRLDEALAAARRFALLHAAGEDVASWPPAVVGGLDTAELAVALDQHGLHAEAERLILGFADRQGLDGSFAGESTRVDAPGAWLHSVGHHVRVTGDPTLAVALVGPVAKAAHHLRRRLGARRGRRGEGTAGLFPAGPSASWVPVGEGPTYHDALWARRGLLDAAFALEAAGQPEAAADPSALADELTAALVAALAADAVPGTGPGRPSAAGTVATAVALAATLTGPEPAPPELAAALAAAVDAVPALGQGRRLARPGRCRAEPAPHGLGRARPGWPSVASTPPSPSAWLLERGAPVWAWPELVHPRSGGGCAGRGAPLRLDRGRARPGAALRRARARWWPRRCCRPCPTRGSASRSRPTAWRPRSGGCRSPCGGTGSGPPCCGSSSPTPIRRWRRRCRGRGPLVLTAPGLDPSWSTTELRGEALLESPGRLRRPRRPPRPRRRPDDHVRRPRPATAVEPVADEVSVELRPGGVTGRVLDVDPPAGGGSFS